MVPVREVKDFSAMVMCYFSNTTFIFLDILYYYILIYISFIVLYLTIFLFPVTDLRLESSAVEELDKLLIHSLFEVAIYPTM